MLSAVGSGVAIYILQPDIEVENLSISVSPSGSGSVSISPSSSDGKYDCGTRVTLTANAASSRYVFDQWSSDASGTNPSITITMDGNKSVTACFVYVPPKRTLTIGVSGQGTTSPRPGTYNYDDGQQVTIIATHSSSYQFDHWSGDVSSSSLTITVRMDSDKSIVANFKITYGLSTSVSPSRSGSISPSSGNYDSGDRVTLTATAATCYRFDHWSGADNNYANPTTMTMNDDKNITAHFSKISYTLSTRVIPSGSGSVSPSSGSYDSSIGVTLTAMPASDYYEFDCWSGDASGTSQTITITMDANKNVVANFKKLWQRIEFKIPGVGFIGPSPRWVEYSKWLQQSEEVTCSVQLKGGSLAYGWDWMWWVKVYDPANNVYRSWDKKLEGKLPSVIEFDFRASYEGKYKIRIIHKEFYDKEGIMTIWPPSWRQTEY